MSDKESIRTKSGGTIKETVKKLIHHGYSETETIEFIIETVSNRDGLG